MACPYFKAPLLLLSILLVASVTPAQHPNALRGNAATVVPAKIQFEDIASKAGLDAPNVYGGDTHKEFIIETTGNGAIIFDYDNDGWPDIYLPNGSTIAGFPKDNVPIGHLYHNNQDGTFTDVTARAGLVH